LEYARELLRHEPGDPRIVLLASLLHEVGVAERARAGEEEERAPLSRRILEEADVHWSVVERVCRLVGCEHGADGLDTPEARAAWDADSLAGMFSAQAFPDDASTEALIEKRFKTKAGREIALRELARAGTRKEENGS
jgi:HD superfamily phosphodiesterase